MSEQGGITRRLLARALLASMFLSVACSPGGAGSNHGGVAAIATGMTPVDEKNVQDAVSEAMRKCMATRGFNFVPQIIPLANYVLASVGGGPLQHAFLVDTSDLRTNGYHILETIQRATSQPDYSAPGFASEQNLSPDQLKAYYVAAGGAPETQKQITVAPGDVLTYSPDSCTTQAGNQIYGDYLLHERDTSQISQIVSGIENTVQASPEWKAADAAWSACMKKSGFDYASRDAAESDVRRHYPANGDATLWPSAHAYELTVARADAGCTDQTGLNQVSLQQLDKAANGLSSQEWATISGYIAMMKQAVVNARHVLGGG